VFTKAYHFIRIYRDLFLILLHPLRLGLPSNVFTWDIRTKTVQTSLDSHMWATYLSCLIHRCLVAVRTKEFLITGMYM